MLIDESILHYGLQRSGTNFFESFFKLHFNLNFDNEVTDRLSPIQKHFRLYNDKSIITDSKYVNDAVISNYSSYVDLMGIKKPKMIFIISKDPYSWFVSYGNWATKCEWSKPTFSFIEEYNLFYGKWLEFSSESENILFIRYIDLVLKPKTVIKTISEKFKLKPRLRSQVGFLPKIRQVSQSGPFTAQRRDYYLKKEYLKVLSTKELEEINDKADRDVVRRLGYEFLI